MRVLVIVAHADDETLGVGGTLHLAARRGDYINIVVATEDYGPKRDLDTALVKLGIKDGAVHRLGLPSVGLSQIPTEKLNGEIANIVRIVRPAVVYTHSASDLHTDHKAVAHATLVACRPVCEGAPLRLLAMDTPSSTEWATGSAIPGAFSPNVFVELTQDALNAKLNAMDVYASEMRPWPHPRSREALTARAMYWGQWASCRFAEPFALLREIQRVS